MKRLPFLLCLFLVLEACDRVPAPPPQPPPIVQAARPLQRDVPVIVEVIGQTAAIANVEVRARVDATVEKIAFVEGSRVRQGDLLFLLDKEPIQQRLAAAKGNLGQLEAALGRAKQDVERLTPLAAKSAVPRKDLDNAVSALQQAEAALDTGKAQVRAAELDLGYTEVRAPVAGVIGAKQVDVGSLVSKGQSTIMATISPLDPIWASIEVSEVAYLNHAEKFKEPGKKDVFTLVRANGEVHPHPGKLVFVDRAVNPTTGTMKVRAEFPNPDIIVRPGQFCRVRVLADLLKDALLVPQRAVVELQGTYNVFVVSDGRASFRPVKMGRRIGSLWMVEKGLERGDVVITEGVLKARDGIAVQAQIVEIDDGPVKEAMASVPGAKQASAPPTPSEK